MAEEVNTMPAGDAGQTARMAQQAGFPEMQTEAVEVPAVQVEAPTEPVAAPVEQAAEPVAAPVEQMTEQVVVPTAPTAAIPVPAPPTAPITDPYPAPAATAPIAEPVAAPSSYAAPATGFAGSAAAANAYAPQPAQPAPPAYQQPGAYQDPYQRSFQSQDFDPNQPIPPYTPAGEAPLTSLTGGMKFGWLVVGFLLTIAGMVLAWLVNADKHPQVKKEAITWAVIGFGINAAIGIIACLAFAGMIAAGIYGSAMDGGYAGIIGGLFI